MCKRKFFVFYFFSIAVFSNCFSQTTSSTLLNVSAVNQFLANGNTIQTAVPFLLVAPDSRAAAMGETGVATSPDVNSIHWNPAKYAFEENKMGIGISYTPWLHAIVPDISLTYISFFDKLDSVSAFGISLRYFSMGNLTFFDTIGNVIGQFRPNEYAIDGCYSRKISNHFSLGMTARLIRSNLTNGITIAGMNSKVSTDVGVDLGAYYHNNEKIIAGKKSTILFGMAITNIGNKMYYANPDSGSFLPTNLRLGAGVQMDADEKNQIGFQLELNKLLVPTPPIYATNTYGQVITNSSGQPLLLAGRNPNVSPAKGMIQSFYDAPGGFQEELHEIILNAGMEYCYAKIFSIRAGYFYQSPTMGYRQYITLGAGVKYNVFSLDFSYLIPTEKENSNDLQNGLRFSLSFDFGKFKPDKKFDAIKNKK